MKTRTALIASLGAMLISGSALAWECPGRGYGPGYGMMADNSNWVAERFNAIDTNNDGFISRAEAEANAPRMSVMFDAIDTNKDSQITLAEMIAFHNNMRDAMQRCQGTRFQDRFNTADTNKDGFLSKEEAEQSMPFIYRSFEAIDIDKDGKISLTEFEQFRATAGPANRGGKWKKGRGYGPGGGYGPGRGYGPCGGMGW